MIENHARVLVAHVRVTLLFGLLDWNHIWDVFLPDVNFEGQLESIH